MFTGLIEEIGRVKKVLPCKGGIIITVKAEKIADELKIGDSVSVNGVCITVTEREDNSFAAFVMEETLKKTNLSKARIGDRVNLERPLKLGARFGGHIVQGHIDSVGRVKMKRKNVLEIDYPVEISPYIAPKGSIAINGVSLTVLLKKGNKFQVALIPFTEKNTNLGSLKVGDIVNIETDIIGKYVIKNG
jgi:riboflavin synthase